MYIFKEERDGNIFKVGILIEALIQVFNKIFIYPMIIQSSIHMYIPSSLFCEGWK